MLKLEGLKLTPEEKEAALHRKAARLLRIPEEDVLSVQVLRRSIDAREELHLVYTVAAEVRQEKQVLRRCRDRRVSRYAPERYALPEILSPPEVPPVVVPVVPPVVVPPVEPPPVVVPPLGFCPYLLPPSS